MPHDMNGYKLDLGDVIITKPYNQGKNKPRDYVGVIVEMEESQQCTGQLMYQTPFEGVVKDYFGAEESLLVMKADGRLKDSL